VTTRHVITIIGACCALAASAQAPDPVRITGSDTVEPIVQAAVAQFARTSPSTKVTIDAKGTSQGFSLLCEAKNDIAMASRPISAKEVAACKARGVVFVEIPIAWDAVVVVANRNDGWLRDITFAELRQMWGTEATQRAMKWSDVRSTYPATKVSLFGLDIKSGTRDFFATAVTGNAAAMRADYQQSADHASVVAAVIKTPGAIGFVSLSHYLENTTTVAALAIDGGAGPVLPSPQTVISDQYSKLSRLLFLYVNKASYDQRGGVREFMDYFMTGAPRFVQYAREVPLVEKNYQEYAARLKG